MFSPNCRAVLSAIVLLFNLGSLQNATAEQWNDNDLLRNFDDDSFGSGDAAHWFLNHWEVALAGGASFINSVHSTLNTPDSLVTNTSADQVVTLNFPARSFTVNSYKPGFSAEATLVRELSDWFGAGVQAGASFEHSNTVEQGSIPEIIYDPLGNLSFGTLDYKIDANATLYYAEPIVRLGHWYPMGHVALKPYISLGGGLYYIEENVVFSIGNGESFTLMRRSEKDFGVTGGAGLDLRFSTSGLVGLQYQAQQIFSDNNGWTVSLPTLRFAYLF